MGDHSSHQSGEDAVGLRISIFCSEGFDPSLEGIITSFDHETGHHGILFDTGVQLDIDISKERVSSSAGKQLVAPTLRRTNQCPSTLLLFPLPR